MNFVVVVALMLNEFGFDGKVPAECPVLMLDGGSVWLPNDCAVDVRGIFGRVFLSSGAKRCQKHRTTVRDLSKQARLARLNRLLCLFVLSSEQ